MHRKVLSGALSLTFLLAFGLSVGHTAIKIGVNAHRGPKYVMDRWSALGEYLSQEMGQPVTIEPLRVSTLMLEVKEKKIDFVFANPVQTVRLKENFQAMPLVTLNTKAGSQFAGVIVARKDSGIRTSEDLRGKDVMSMRFKVAAGGYIFQTYHLRRKGINPHKDFASMYQVKNQVSLVKAVRRGVIDAAFIRSGLLEKLAKAKKINMDDFVIVDYKAPSKNFAFGRTTTLYPEWYISAMPDTDSRLAKKLRAALMKLTPNSQVSQVAKIRGFVAPLPMNGLRAAMRALKVPPYHRSDKVVARTRDRE